MQEFKKLVNYCKASISLIVNEHKSCYDSVMEYLKDCSQDDMTKEIEQEILAKMVELNTVVKLQFYPLTPIGFYVIYHYDIDEAVREAVKIIEDNLKSNPHYLKDLV